MLPAGTQQPLRAGHVHASYPEAAVSRSKKWAFRLRLGEKPVSRLVELDSKRANPPARSSPNSLVVEMRLDSTNVIVAIRRDGFVLRRAA